MRQLLVTASLLFCVSPILAQQPDPNPPPPKTQEQPSPAPTNAPSTGASVDTQPQSVYVHVYRQHRYVGSALAPTISVDDKKVARLGNGRRFTARLSPGVHSIRSDDKSSAISIDAKPGQEYYVRVDEETGAWKGHGKLTLLMPEQGKPEYEMQKPVEADRRLAQDMLEADSDIVRGAKDEPKKKEH